MKNRARIRQNIHRWYVPWNAPNNSTDTGRTGGSPVQRGNHSSRTQRPLVFAVQVKQSFTL